MRRLLSALCLSLTLVAPAIADDTELTALGPLDPALAPRAAMQIAGARIGWRMDDLRSAFRAAALDG